MSTPIHQTQAPEEEEADVESSGSETSASSPVRADDEAPERPRSLDQEAPAAEAQTAAPLSAPRRGARRWVAALVVLLGLSLLANYFQWQDRSELSARAEEYSTALGSAVDRLDELSARARFAENALEAVDGAIVTVRERATALQEAIDRLEASAQR